MHSYAKINDKKKNQPELCTFQKCHQVYTSDASRLLFISTKEKLKSCFLETLYDQNVHNVF